MLGKVSDLKLKGIKLDFWETKGVDLKFGEGESRKTNKVKLIKNKKNRQRVLESGCNKHD